MKRVVTWALAALVGLGAVSCSSEKTVNPPEDFLDRTVIAADPGWLGGRAENSEVPLRLFAQTIDGEKGWEQVEAAWLLRAKGPQPGSDQDVETTFTFEKASEEGLENAVLLASIRRGTKTFTKREIWALTLDRAKAAKAAAAE